MGKYTPILDINKVTSEELLIQIGNRCHEGVTLYRPDWGSGWYCSVCSLEVGPYDTPNQAIVEFYKKYAVETDSFC